MEIEAEQESWMQTTVQGAGTVTFEWMVYSEENDYLEFYIDGQFKCDIDGEETWGEMSYPVTGQGSHTLKWRFYTSDESSGGGCGWVDNVQWSGSPEPVPDPAKWDTITYKYDPDGRRIEKSGNGEAIKYCYDGDHVIAEYDGNDRLLRKYVHGARVDEPVCMIEVTDSNAVYYYHFDGLGSVVALSDSAGDSVQSYEYTVYGQVAAEDPNHPNPYMFTGRQFDIETGLYYYRARYYNPHIGRFMQTDPVGYADGINWYLYCGNNPVGFVDPSGYDRQVVTGKYLVLPNYNDPDTAKKYAWGKELAKLIIDLGSEAAGHPEVGEITEKLEEMAEAVGAETQTFWRAFIEVYDWDDEDEDGIIDDDEKGDPYWIEVIEICSGSGENCDSTAWATGTYETWGDAADAAGTAIGWAWLPWEGSGNIKKPVGVIPVYINFTYGYTYHDYADPYVRHVHYGEDDEDEEDKE